jgi:hypothetical protein
MSSTSLDSAGHPDDHGMGPHCRGCSAFAFTMIQRPSDQSLDGYRKCYRILRGHGLRRYKDCASEALFDNAAAFFGSFSLLIIQLWFHSSNPFVSFGISSLSIQFSFACLVHCLATLKASLA